MKKRVLLCMGMSVGLLLITGVSAAGPVYAPGQPAPTPSSAKKATMDESATEAGADIDWALQDVIDQVATTADEVGVNDPLYTGSVVDVQNARLLIYRKSSMSGGFDVKKYLALAPVGVSIVFAAAPLSAKEIEKLYRLIESLSPEFKAAGIRLNSWGTDFAGGMRVLYTSNTLEMPRWLREKLEIYGPGTVSFQVGSVEAMAAVEGSDRQADTSPFAGGARGPWA